MDQTDLGDRMAVLMVCLRGGGRSLPLAWIAEAGTTNIGSKGQRIVLERVRGWLPAGVPVMLSADRFYPLAALLKWLHDNGWHYQRRLKGNLLADPGTGDETPRGRWPGESPSAVYFAGIRSSSAVDHRDGLPPDARDGARLRRSLGESADVLRLQAPRL